MEPLLSIVIPVYNMEMFLQKTLESLECSGMTRLQVIIVNDGSTDGSQDIAHTWVEGHKSIALLMNKDNGGHGSAWNEGVKLATGRYLAFLDSDDWVENIESMLNRLEKAEADLVFNDMVLYYDENGHSAKEKIKGITEGIHNIDTEGVPLQKNNPQLLNFHYCIYKTEIIRQVVFHNKTSYDDLILSTMPLALAESYEYSGMPFYVYRTGRSGQSMNPKTISKKIKQQETERKYAIDSALKLFPSGSKGLKAEAIHHIIRSICTTFYNFTMKLEEPERSCYLVSWTEYVGFNVPQCQKIFEYKAFVKFPRILYAPSLKICHLFRKTARKLRVCFEMVAEVCYKRIFHGFWFRNEGA